MKWSTLQEPSLKPVPHTSHFICTSHLIVVQYLGVNERCEIKGTGGFVFSHDPSKKTKNIGHTEVGPVCTLHFAARHISALPVREVQWSGSDQWKHKWSQARRASLAASFQPDVHVNKTGVHWGYRWTAEEWIMLQDRSKTFRWNLPQHFLQGQQGVFHAQKTHLEWSIT